ncbi:MAG: hypothetical protein CUN55_09670 [Phototrophicales bacterium]|nr:MAG: hypothetical protein CUN55_09670 [Phototrophicales bacterium]
MEALTIVDIAPDGRGIAYLGEKTVFVPNTIPGEVVHIRVIHETDTQIDAEVESFEEISADRVEPRDEGCLDSVSWQHIQYEAQLALKADIVSSALENIAKIPEPPLAWPIASVEQWAYARRMTFFPTTEGILGYQRAQKIIPIETCAIAHPHIMNVLDELNMEFDTITRLDIHVNDLGDSMLVLQTSDDAPPELEINIAGSINFLLSDHEPVNLIGDTHIVHQVGKHSVRLTAGVFSRPNVPQWQALAQTVLEAAQPQEDDSILDVYGGIGLFSLFLAPHVNYITYIERYPPAATDAEFNLAAFEHVDIVEGRAEVILDDIAADRDHEDYATIILDPTKRLSDSVLQALRKLNIPRIVYVSSDMVHMAKDINVLVWQMRYQLVGVQPIDTDPQTPNLTCVCLLERR